MEERTFTHEEWLAYKRHIDNQRLRISVIETAIYKGERRAKIEVARTLLEKKFAFEEIVEISELTMLEVEAIARGEDIDKEED